MLNFNQDDFTPPISKFEAMLKTNQVLFFDAQEFEGIVQYYIDYGKLNLADRALEIGINQHPTNGELLLLKSEILIFEGEFKKSLEVIKIAEKFIPQHEEIFLQKATIASKSKQHYQAIEFLNKALDFSEDQNEIWALLGMEYLILEDFQSAKYYFQLCLKDDILDYQSLYNLLYAYDQLNDSNGAINTLNSILEKDPYSEVAWHQLGKIYFSQNKFKEAIAAFEFAIISDDKFSGAYIEIGKIQEKLRKYNLAIENYHIALQINDPSAFVYYKIAKCHELLSNHTLFIDFINKAIKVDPTFEKGWISIIKFFILKKDYKNALKYGFKAIESNGDSSFILSLIGDILFLTKKYSDAVIYFENIIEINKNYTDKKVWINLIDCLIILYKLNRARVIIDMALEYLTSSTEILFRLAIIELKLGNNKLAEKHLKLIDKSTINNLLKNDLYYTYRNIV